MARDISIPFSEMLRRARTTAGLTQQELAERARLSTRAISDLERGRKLRPHAYTVGRLVQALELGDQETERFQAAARAGDATTSSRSTASLPIPPTSFVGRRRDVAQVGAYLQQADIRLLTLTGPGGIGKTRLALEVIREIADRVPDGACVVPLAALEGPDLVGHSIATELGLAYEDGTPIIDTVASYLRGKRMILVLDNFEHLLAASEIPAHLVLSCPNLTVLVTSRAPLHLAAEHEYPVSPLSLPDSSRIVDPNVLAGNDAVALFLRRARMIKPDFELTIDNASAVHAICRRLDGLPLAIELAASRVKLVPPHTLLRLLGNPLTMLTGGPRDLPLRHRTLRATLDWSYSLLQPEEQMLFQRLAVFSNPASLEAVEAACEFPDDLLDLLSSLVESSLLRAEETNGEPRFRMLATIREYALERLSQSGEEPIVGARHADYFLRVAEQAHAVLVVNAVPEWLDRMQECHDDLRAALAWFLQHGDNEQSLRLTVYLWAFWSCCGYYSIARVSLEAAVALPCQRMDHLRAAALIALGVVSNSLGDPELAETRTRESLRLAKQLKDMNLVLACLRQLARSAQMRGNLSEARRIYEEALAMARDADDDLLVAAALHGLSLVCLLSGGHRAAVIHAEQCLELARHTGNARTSVTAINDLGCGLMAEGNIGRALRVLEQGVALAREVGLHWSLANLLNSLGLALFLAGDGSASAACQRECLGLAGDLQDRGLIAYGIEGLALLAEMQGRSEHAVRLWGAAESLRATTWQSTPFEHDLYRRAQETLRARLGQELYDHYWRLGRAMTVEQALLMALDDVAPHEIS